MGKWDWKAENFEHSIESRRLSRLVKPVFKEGQALKVWYREKLYSRRLTKVKQATGDVVITLKKGEEREASAKHIYFYENNTEALPKVDGAPKK